MALLLLAGCGQPAPNGQEQTLVENVDGYACDADGIVRFDRLGFSSTGRIICRGENCAGVEAGRRLDGAGKTLWPGLIDAHAHLLGLGRARQSLDLTGSESVEVVKDRLADWAASRPEDEWLVGRGWNQMAWPSKKFPSAADLDAIVPDRAVVLERVDGHALWVNSAALRRAGIGPETQAPEGGEILRDDSGAATGILVDKAERLVTALMPEPGLTENKAAYMSAIEEANRYGLTGVHEAGASFDELRALKALAADGDLTLRVNVMLSDSDENLARQGEPEKNLFDGRLSVDSVKIYADGALGSRGAALQAAYSDRADTRGLLFLSQQQLAARIEKANSLGFQSAVHAIGDRANHVTLNAYQQVQQGRPSPLRNRIEHAQILLPGDIPRFAELGVIASMQPVHATSDMWMAEERLDPARLEGAYAWRSLHEAGATLAFGSDFPVEAVNPFYGLHAAVTRTDRNGKPVGGWRADERLDLGEALCGFSRDAAFAGRNENEVGSLRPGQWADFIVLSDDPFALPAAALWQTEVAETWVGGERVYQRNAN